MDIYNSIKNIFWCNSYNLIFNFICGILMIAIMQLIIYFLYKIDIFSKKALIFWEILYSLLYLILIIKQIFFI